MNKVLELGKYSFGMGDRFAHQAKAQLQACFRVARNVAIENVTVAQTPRVLNVRGFPGAEISNVRIYYSTFKQVAKSDVVQDANVKLVNCSLEPVK
ncbi:MAG: hypothetical protein ABSB84_02495 [Verrucomicrobiota bacterium]|jgi:hypothetical protein